MFAVVPKVDRYCKGGIFVATLAFIILHMTNLQIRVQHGHETLETVSEIMLCRKGCFIYRNKERIGLEREAKILHPDMDEQVVRAISGASRGASEDKGAFTVVKCRLNTIIRDEKLLPTIEEAVRFHTRVSVWSSRLLTLHVLRLTEEGKAIPRLTTGYLGRVIRCCAYSDIACLRKLDSDLAASRKRFFELVGDEAELLPKGVPKQWRPLLIDELALQFKTAIENSVKTRLWKVLRRWFYATFKHDFPKKKSVGIFGPFCNTLYRNGKPLTTWTPYYKDLYGHVQSLGLNWETPTPETVLPIFCKLLSEMETFEKCRLFSILPLYGTGTKHVPISTSVLREMARDLGYGKDMETEDKATLWRRLYKFDAVTRGAKKFAFRITTNGADCSILYTCRRPPGLKKNECEKLPNSAISLRPGQKILAIDPGRRDIMHGVYYAVPENLNSKVGLDPMPIDLDLLRFSKNKYRTACGMRTRAKFIRGRIERVPILEEYETNVLSAKVSSSENFERYLVCFSQYARAVLSFYGKKKVVEQRFKLYMKRQRTECALVKSIDPDTIIAFGDASIGNHFGHLESTPNKRIKALIKKNFKVVDVDEHRTSLLCSNCVHVLRMPKMLQRLSKKEKRENERKKATEKKKEEKVPVWGVRRCDNKGCRKFWNRDTNAARNILNVFLCSVWGETLPAPYLRSHDKFGKKLREEKGTVATVVAKRRETSCTLCNETQPATKRTNTTEV